MNYIPTSGPAAAPPRLTIPMKEFCQPSGMGKSNGWQLIRDGQRAVTRVGRRTLISYESALALVAPTLRESYLAALPGASLVSPEPSNTGGQA